jgi:hypothetical protein
MNQDELDDDVQKWLDRMNAVQAAVGGWRRRNWTVIIAVTVLSVVVVGVRLGWEYQTRHNRQHQCAALHLLQEDQDHYLHTTDIAASSRFKILQADRALQQLHAEVLLRRHGKDGLYPGYSLKISGFKMSQRCENVEYRDILRARKHWRLE